MLSVSLLVLATLAARPGIASQSAQDIDACARAFAMIEIGGGVAPLESELPDPALVRRWIGDQFVFEVHGTGKYFLRFGSWDDLLLGRYERIHAPTLYPDGASSEGPGLVDWDQTIDSWYRIPETGKWWLDTSLVTGPYVRQPPRPKDPDQVLEVRYGGSMSPPPGERVASWPRDNSSRDVFAYVRGADGAWIRRPRSIFAAEGEPARRPGDFLGHRYGHRFFAFDGEIWVAYEEVTETRPDGYPARTELFVRRMIDPFTADTRAVPLLRAAAPDGRAFPSTVRRDGGVLVEGPSLAMLEIEGKPWVACGFSPGDWFDQYGVSFAFLPAEKFRRLLRGELDDGMIPSLDDSGTDLFDSARSLASRHGLRAPGRPFLFHRPDGKLGVLLHAFKQGGPDYRVPFLAEAGVAIGKNGIPRLSLR